VLGDDGQQCVPVIGSPTGCVAGRLDVQHGRVSRVDLHVER
jgi:hypothetical protein